ncbi:conserved hypothetical protein [Methanothermus fervidus DSM 2088]|uniref:Metallo-beta-lactamase domain-containing protein n=1 Tax=Methanothermus fervidus (strain ATCC 43054 / DSM 2088 / JCM 10308 / V24 S) TaxID=523846 RepID=E3GYB8_METFV|nr:MBL fold metallo-hydrolase [Methanothermus fervidus]ADP77300.1 conserved hypothetical protein [Methanothermus fervidus DSM 2088]
MDIEDIIIIPGKDYDSNIYVIDNTIIDTGTGHNKNYVFSKMKKAGVDPEDIKLIINTHCHYDHIGGNSLFSAKIAIHKKDSEALEKGDKMATVSYLFGEKCHPMKVHKKLKDGNKIAGFKVIHTPGHTPGSICLFSDGILISGDTIFANGGFGSCDYPGGNMEDLINSIKKIKSYDVEYLLPGHGEIVNNGNFHINLAFNKIKKLYNFLK